MEKLATEKAMEILDAWLDGKKFGRMKPPPPCTVWEFWTALHDLARCGKAETINGTVKDVLEKCGFSVEAEGIGWAVTIPRIGGKQNG